MKKPRIVAVVAIGRNRELGNKNKLLWHIPDDLKRFKRLTEGHPIIMGRKTFESIAGYLRGPLPERTNIVITRNPDWVYDGVVVARSLEEAIETASEIDSEEIHIGGGAELYKQALPIIDRLYLTLVDADPPAGGEADAYFPPYENLFAKKVFEEHHWSNGLHYTWVDLER